MIDLGSALERANAGKSFKALASPMNKRQPSEENAMSKKAVLKEIQEANELEKRIVEDDRIRA